MGRGYSEKISSLQNIDTPGRKKVWKENVQITSWQNQSEAKSLKRTGNYVLWNQMLPGSTTKMAKGITLSLMRPKTAVEFDLPAINQPPKYKIPQKK